MELTDMPSEPEVQSGEELIHMDRVVIVEKEECIGEEEDSDDGSVITGDESIGDNSGEDDICGDGVANAVEETREKLEVPEEFAKSVMVLTCDSTVEGGFCDVYLVGTAHVSQESCREVEAVISSLKPQVVFVELCTSRLSILNPQPSKEAPSLMEMIGMWKGNHNLFGIVYGWFLAKMANKLEVFPGAEFRVACEEAMKNGGKVVFGDRPVQITLTRTWGKMPLWHKIKLLYGIVFQAVFLPDSEELEKMLKDMNDVDMLTLVIQEMSKEFPSLMETLVHERDKYMASLLFRVASEHSSVVAVVGRGHLQGIKKNWKQPINMKELLELPTNNSTYTLKNILRYAVVVVAAGVAIIAGMHHHNK
ncbi:PREDICTED: traB domain-containing protein-like [Camelina sativa]|uniref:TraB domain-containing protein-like n=1 Tax=Camelina sativa TaxID=90675 RepID=A0ABM0Z3U8_CAMSA|nr:PREDICTED: traB domain-containing protein-like [Camelina sativa]XP_010510036.1 PREDICTED: traB domain-containing protein-like [Camelina sativa]